MTITRASIEPRCACLALAPPACVLALALAGCQNFSGSVERPLAAKAVQAAAVTDAPSTQHWPQWRGGLSAGVSNAEALPLRWGERHNVAWKSGIAGQGNSSPIVWQQRVFLTTAVGQGERAQLRLLALDAHTGSLLWERDAGRPIGQTHQKNGYASSTPATDGERVYACFGPKGLFCYSVEGERLWHQPLDTQAHEWGAASSPVLAGNLVVQLCDSASQSFLLALDKFTGEQRWRTSRESNGCWTTPALVHAAPGESQAPRWELVVNGSGSRDGSKGLIHAYDPWTGQPLWHVRGTADIVCPTAIVGQGLVVSTSGNSGPIIAVRPGGSGEAAVAWQFPTGGMYVPTGLIYRRRLFLVDDDGVVSCRSLDDGRPIWRERVGGPVSASLVAGAGRVYVASESGDVYVLAAEDQFALLATNSLNEPCLATPAIAHGRLFVRTQSNLWCIAEETTSPPESEPAADAAGGGVIISPSDTAAP